MNPLRWLRKCEKLNGGAVMGKRGRKQGLVGLAVVVATGVLGLAGCSNGNPQVEQAGRDFGNTLRSEASNFTETNRSLASQANERWSPGQYTTGTRGTGLSGGLRSWSAPEVRARLSPEIGISRVGEVKEADLSRAVLKLPDGKSVADVVLWDRPGTSTTFVLVRASLSSASARANSALTLKVHANDDPTNGDGCRADTSAAPSTWFASADAAWGRGGLPALRLDDKRTASPVWTVTSFSREDVEGKALILYGQSGTSTGVGPSTRLACGVFGGF
jgi:hypothetical protein